MAEKIGSPENPRKKRRAHLRKRSIIETGVKTLTENRSKIEGSSVTFVTVDMPFQQNLLLKNMLNYMKKERIFDVHTPDVMEYFRIKTS